MDKYFLENMQISPQKCRKFSILLPLSSYYKIFIIKRLRHSRICYLL